MNTQDKKTPARTDSATTKNDHASKPSANGKKEGTREPSADKKAEIKQVPDTTRTTMNVEKNPTAKKETK
ncbi:MAG: hypothetical protein ABI599_14050 [Flavobacteriales bacterium]